MVNETSRTCSPQIAVILYRAVGSFGLSRPFLDVNRDHDRFFLLEYFSDMIKYKFCENMVKNKHT